MAVVTRSGTKITFPLEVILPATAPLPAVPLKSKVEAQVKLKRTDPKSEVGIFILKEFESLLKRSIDLRLKPFSTNIAKLWQTAAKAINGVDDTRAAIRIADKAKAQAEKQINDFTSMLETDTIHAALTMARKKAEKEFGKKLAGEESVTTRGVREFGKQASEVGEALFSAAETVVGLAETATSPIKVIKALKDLSKGKVEIWDKMVDLYRKVSKERTAKLARVRDRFTKSKALFEEVQNELSELHALRNSLASQVSTTTGRYDKLDRQIQSASNLDFDKSRAPLYRKLADDGLAANKVLDEVAKTLAERDALGRKVSAAIKAIEDVMTELDIEIKIASKDDDVMKKLALLKSRHEAAVTAISKAA